jgi:phosphate transport system substrate-binding protein
VLPLAEAFATRFIELYPDVRVETAGGGSGSGTTQCDAGTVDIGAISRDLKPSEPKLKTHLFAREGIAIVVHQDNPIAGLTIGEVAQIFAGEITNWKDVGGEDRAITIYAREEGSGTRDYFEETVMKGKDISASSRALFKAYNGEIQFSVEYDPSGIAFVSLGYVEGLKVLKLNGVECTMANCLNEAYPLVRPFYFITKEEPIGLVKEFIDFCQSPPGQLLVKDKGYIPIGEVK